MENVNFVRKQMDFLNKKLKNSAATFTYKPDEIEKIKQQIFDLQERCPHEFENGKCKYCDKGEENAD